MNKFSGLSHNVKQFVKYVFTSNLKEITVHSFLLMLLYTALLAGGVFLFYKWNFVLTRELSVRQEVLWGVYEKHITVTDTLSDTVIWGPKLDLTIRIPMTMQSSEEATRGSVNWKVSSVKDASPYIQSITKIVGNRIATPRVNVDSLKAVALSNQYIDDEYKQNLMYFCVKQKWTGEEFKKPDRGMAIPEVYKRLYVTNELEGNKENPVIEYITRSFDGETYKNEKYFGSMSPEFYSQYNSSGNLICTPGWTNLCDISQCYYKINILSQTIPDYTLTIDFASVANFSVIVPEPDSRTMSSITYTDREKLNMIRGNGLEFHVSFNEMQNKQTIRSFALTCLMSLVFGLWMKEIFILAYHSLWKRGRRRKSDAQTEQ